MRLCSWTKTNLCGHMMNIIYGWYMCPHPWQQFMTILRKNLMPKKSIISPYRVGYTNKSIHIKLSIWQKWHQCHLCANISKSLDEFQFSEQERNEIGISKVNMKDVDLQTLHKYVLKNVMNSCSTRKLRSWHFFIFSFYHGRECCSRTNEKSKRKKADTVNEARRCKWSINRIFYTRKQH